MLDLWELMGNLFGSVFTKQYGTVEGNAFNQWGHFLSNLTADQVKQGFAAMSKDSPKFPPNAVEFRGYCMALEAYGLREAPQAFADAIRFLNLHSRDGWQRKWWHHPIEALAIHDVGFSVMKTMRREYIEPRYTKAYMSWAERAIAGEELPDLTMLRLEDRKAKPMDRDRLRAGLAELKADLGQSMEARGEKAIDRSKQRRG